MRRAEANPVQGCGPPDKDIVQEAAHESYVLGYERIDSHTRS